MLGEECSEDLNVIRVDAIVEIRREESEKERYEGAMWAAAGFEEPAT